MQTRSDTKRKSGEPLPDEKIRAAELGCQIELARRHLFYYCQLMSPNFYMDDREYLYDVCETMQKFIESDKRILVINMPPRHGKSFTASRLIEWLLGKDPTIKVMMGSYNETLSTRFSKMVRDTIMEQKADFDRIVYSDIFPASRIKEGDGAMNLWSLEGSYANYLSTSPGGTATGFGANIICIDDLIKNDYEAYSEASKARQWDWFTNTMLSRLEEGGKIIVIMTRWATDDLAGRVMQEFPPEDIEHINFKAVQEDGSMLCDEILSRESCETKKRLMGADIWSANYQQEPIDLKDRLYSGFLTYDTIPSEGGKPLFTAVKAYVDTADTGSDFLCAIAYGVYQHCAYVLDVLYTQKSMEETEPETARLLNRCDVRVADIESNNGGRGFARNVERILREELQNRKCRIQWFTQRANKEARILSNATTVMRQVLFPKDWKYRWPTFYDALMKHQREGRNLHDDAPDALTGVIEKMERTGVHINPAILR